MQESKSCALPLGDSPTKPIREGGYRDSNPRPPEPQSGALTNCAIPTIKRIRRDIILSDSTSLKGFEPPTHGLEGRCSIQLIYRLICFFVETAKQIDISLFPAEAYRQLPGTSAFASVQSGWWESNPRIQLGRLVFYHWTTPAYSVGVTGFEPATSWSQTRRSSQAEPHPVFW